MCQVWTDWNSSAKSNIVAPDLPVVMVTAYGGDERRRRASEVGAFEFITKPVDFDQLKEQLRQLPVAAVERAAINNGIGGWL
jgi:DNA-binding NtrC family response regulator